MAKYRDAAFAKWASEQFDWNLTPELIALDVASVGDDWHFEAQRSLDGECAAGMAEHFLPAVGAGVIVAQLPTGHRVFIDGQHRWKAAKDAGQKTIYALLFHMSEEQAAAFFRLRNGPAVRQSTHMDSTLSAEQATYPLVVGLANVLDKNGCYLDRNRSQRQGAVGSSTRAEAIYAVDNGRLLDQTLEIVTECWGRGPIALSAEVLEGVALFLGHFRSQLDPQRWRELKQRLREQDLDMLVNEAIRQWKQYRSVSRKALYIEEQIIIVFNVKRSQHRLPSHGVPQLAKLPSLLRMAEHARLKQPISA